MPDAKVTGLGSLTGANVANGDAVMIVDVSDMTMAGTGTNKRITADQLAQMPQLSSRYASSTAFPSGVFTAWTGINPTATSGTITTSSAQGNYQQFGKLIVCQFTVSVNTQGTAAAFMELTLPVSARFVGPNIGGVGIYREVNIGGTSGMVFLASATTARLARQDNTGPWVGDGAVYRGTFQYEVA